MYTPCVRPFTKPFVVVLCDYRLNDGHDFALVTCCVVGSYIVGVNNMN